MFKIIKVLGGIALRAGEINTIVEFRIGHNSYFSNKETWFHSYRNNSIYLDYPIIIGTLAVNQN